MSVIEGTYKAVRILGYGCNRCHHQATYEDDQIEAQEFLHWEGACGYGSVFGDGNEISLTLCQHCLKDVLGQYIVVEHEGDGTLPNRMGSST
jgi:hypothetical protein